MVLGHRQSGLSDTQSWSSIAVAARLSMARFSSWLRSLATSIRPSAMTG